MPFVLSRVSRRTWIITAAAVVVVGTGIGIFASRSSGNTADDTNARTITATASRQTMEKSVSGSGTVSPAVQDDVSFTVSGTVTSVAVQAGQTVTAGAVLATVDKLQVNASLLQAKSTLADAQATLASAKSANDGSDRAVARENAAQAAVDVAQAAVTDAQGNVAATTLVAPAAGLITAVNIAVGDRVSASGSAAFTLVSTDAWTVTVNISETDIAHVAKDQKVTLTTTDRQNFTGTVTTVGLLPTTSSGAARYPVTVTVTGNGKGLYDGVTVDVAIIYESRANVLTVPSAAVTTANGASYVVKVEADGTQTRTAVTVGETSGGLTEIVSGLKEGDKVVVVTFTTGQGGTNGRGNGNGYPGSGQFPGGFGGQGGFGGGGGGTRGTGGGQGGTRQGTSGGTGGN